mmetsp:Transcript_50812/g.69140  ORF Transcript_50812/g.69140 Transcript_50812/m.69140 type:complete len:125 (-) Transcript_50812:226-600(-)
MKQKGMFETPDGDVIVTARHSWNLRSLHLWPWDTLAASSFGLERTSFYGEAGDGFIPASVLTGSGEGGGDPLREPARMTLPPQGTSRWASTAKSLAGALVEVVPSSVKLIGIMPGVDEGPVVHV